MTNFSKWSMHDDDLPPGGLAEELDEYFAFNRPRPHPKLPPWECDCELVTEYCPDCTPPEWECDCVTPEMSCRTCRAAARERHGDSIPFGGE